MQIQRIQNSNYNMNRTPCPNFKGEVSHEFVRYVNELRKDCLEFVHEQSPSEINNICDSILDRANIIMEKCFHPSSVLSIDKTRVKGNDTIIIPNNIFTKYILDPLPAPAGYLNKKGLPTKRLDNLTSLINGHHSWSSFLEAYSSVALSLYDTVCILENYADDNCDKEVLLKNILDWFNFSGQTSVDNPIINILKGKGNYQHTLKDMHNLFEFGEKHIDILAAYYDNAQFKEIYGQCISESKQKVEILILKAKNHQARRIF